jgi:Leucine-rich repeat (LRR) protein
LRDFKSQHTRTPWRPTPAGSIPRSANSIHSDKILGVRVSTQPARILIQRQNGEKVAEYSLGPGTHVVGRETSAGVRVDLLTYEDSEEAKAAVVINAPPPERSLEVQFLDGELTKADLEKVTNLTLSFNKLTEVPKGLEKLTQLKELYIQDNKLTDVKGLENLTKLEALNLANNQLTDVSALANLTQLEWLYLHNNPNLTKVQIDELKKTLPRCDIQNNPKK